MFDMKRGGGKILCRRSMEERGAGEMKFVGKELKGSRENRGFIIISFHLFLRDDVCMPIQERYPADTMP